MGEDSDVLSSLLLELRRGVIVLCVLSQLDKPKYGYSLMQDLEDKGIPIDAGTLYPLMRRLEKQELLSSEWEVGGTKPRKYYVLSGKGREIYRRLLCEWAAMEDSMAKMLGDEGGK